MNPSRVNWGVVFILIGCTFLATNLDYVSDWVWWDLLHFWPVLLIAIGIDLVFRKSKLKALSYISTLLIVATFAYVIWLNGGIRGLEDHTWIHQGKSVAAVDYDGQTSADVAFKLDDGRVYYNSGNDALIRVVSRDRSGGIGLESDCNGSQCKVTVTEQERHWLARLARDYDRYDDRDWRCYLNPRTDYSLTFDLDNTEIRFFAEDLFVKSMRIDADYSDIRLKFGTRQPLTQIDIRGRTNDVEFFFPQSAGLRLAGIHLNPDAMHDLGVVEEGNALVSDNYHTASTKFEVVSQLDNSDVVIKRF